MNKQVYEGLPDDLRAVIDANSGYETSAWAGRAHDIGDKDGYAAMEASGNEIAELSEEVTAKIKALGAEVTQEWITEMTDRGLDGAGLVRDAQGMVEEARGEM